MKAAKYWAKRLPLDGHWEWCQMQILDDLSETFMRFGQDTGNIRNSANSAFDRDRWIGMHEAVKRVGWCICLEAGAAGFGDTWPMVWCSYYLTLKQSQPSKDSPRCQRR